MTFDKFSDQAVKRSAGSSGLLQHLVAIFTFEDGPFKSLDLALNTPNATQQFAIVCYMRHTKGQYTSAIEDPIAIFTTSAQDIGLH